MRPYHFTYKPWELVYRPCENRRDTKGILYSNRKTSTQILFNDIEWSGDLENLASSPCGFIHWSSDKTLLRLSRLINVFNMSSSSFYSISNSIFIRRTIYSIYGYVCFSPCSEPDFYKIVVCDRRERYIRVRVCYNIRKAILTRSSRPV